MSILIFGLSLPQEADSASPSSGLTIRELILRNVATTLGKIKGRMDPVGRASNSSQKVRVESSGTYTGTEYRKYRVQVVTGGLSGVAAVTATDVTTGLSGSPDNGPTAALVTSGTPLALGSLGVSIEFTFAGTLVLGDYWDIECGIYQSSVAIVTRQQDEHPSASVLCAIQEPIEDAEDQPIGYTTKRMDLVVRCHVNSVQSPESEIEKILGDMEKALMTDPTRGGYAIDSQVLTNAAYALDDLKASSGFDLHVGILYRHLRSDPRSQ